MTRVCEGEVATVYSEIRDFLVRCRDGLHERDPASRVQEADLLWRNWVDVRKHFNLRSREEEAEGFLAGAVSNSCQLEELRFCIFRDVAKYPGRAVKDLVLWDLVIWERERGPLPDSWVMALLRSVVEPYVQLVAGEEGGGGCLLRRVPVLGFVPMDADMCAEAAWWIVAQLPDAPPKVFTSYDATRAGLETYLALQITRCQIQMDKFRYTLPSGRMWTEGRWKLLADAFSRSPLGRYLSEEPDHQVVCGPVVYKVCQTCRCASKGRCLEGHDAAVGAGMSCHRCHARLPWAFEGAYCRRNHPDNPVTTRRGRQDKRLISPRRAVDVLPADDFEEPEPPRVPRFVGSPYVLGEYWTSACGNICDLAWDRCPLCGDDRWLWKCEDKVHHSAAELECPSCHCDRREGRVLHLYAQPPHPLEPSLKHARVVEWLRAERQSTLTQIRNLGEVFWDPCWGDCPAERTRRVRPIVKELEHLANCVRIAVEEVDHLSSKPGLDTPTGNHAAHDAARRPEDVVRDYLNELSIALDQNREHRGRLLAEIELELAEEGDHIRELLTVGRGR